MSPAGSDERKLKAIKKEKKNSMTVGAAPQVKVYALQQLFYFLVVHTFVYSVHVNESVDDEEIDNEVGWAKNLNNDNNE